MICPGQSADPPENRFSMKEGSGIMNRITLCLVLGIALCSSTAWGSLIYKIDIDSTTQGGGLPLQTQPGWTSLDATQPSEGDSVIVKGVEFKVASTDGSRLRVSGGSPNPNALTGDFVFDDGAGQAVILLFGGAGDLQAGIWEVDVYTNDSGAQPGAQIVGWRKNNAETIVSTSVSPSAIDPAITFRFQSDGVSAYDVFVRENSGNNRSRLNAVQLTYIPEPATVAVWGLLGLCWAGMRVWRRRGRLTEEAGARRAWSNESRTAIRQMLDEHLQK
jgi:hypothetical protein